MRNYILLASSIVMVVEWIITLITGKVTNIAKFNIALAVTSTIVVLSLDAINLFKVWRKRRMQVSPSSPIKVLYKRLKNVRVKIPLTISPQFGEVVGYNEKSDSLIVKINIGIGFLRDLSEHDVVFECDSKTSRGFSYVTRQQIKDYFFHGEELSPKIRHAGS